MKIRNQINMAILSSLGLIGMAVAADQAQVAKLVRIDGAAVASQDAKYVPAREGMTLKEGDRLMVLEGGSAILAFADGCQFELGEMAMLAVQGVSTCAANGGGVYKVDPKSGIADGAVPQPQLAAIGNKKARSKAQCDAAAKNANPKDDCDCEERRNNSDKDDDCPPVALMGGGGAAAAAGTGTAGTAAATTGGILGLGAGATAAVVGIGVVGVAAAASAANNNDDNPTPRPISVE
jgi:hypothetical protein